MTKADFIKKYSQNYQLLKDKFVNKDKELESDLNEVIKDVVIKYRDILYTEGYGFIYDEDIETILKQLK